MNKNTQNCAEIGKRSLKVYSKYFTRFQGFFIAPEIRLCGKWLQNLGFNCSDNVKVITEKNRIVIRNSKKIKIIL
ncbi:MAG: type I addiction module toxin, SymE family [Bacteroidetes bacterium]|nr:type I addiction module toxin, SymE family [Bacteroidota bacterium]